MNPVVARQEFLVKCLIKPQERIVQMLRNILSIHRRETPDDKECIALYDCLGSELCAMRRELMKSIKEGKQAQLEVQWSKAGLLDRWPLLSENLQMVWAGIESKSRIRINSAVSGPRKYFQIYNMFFIGYIFIHAMLEEGRHGMVVRAAKTACRSG